MKHLIVLGGTSVRHLCGLLGVTMVALVLGTLVSGDDKPKSKNYTPTGWKKLDLTATQREKINLIHTDYKKKIDDLSKQLDDLKKKRTKEMFAVLTKKQKEQLFGADDSKESGTTKDKNK
jgi:Spy/CpxP family protein refolding chaperone